MLHYTAQRYFHTLKYLRPSQIIARLWFKAYSPSVKQGAVPALNTPDTDWKAPAHRPPMMLSAHQCIFLNEEGEVGRASDWNDDSKEKLWLYNLHYFDDLNAAGAPERVDWHRALIQRWVDENPPVTGNGWEPYPSSLRIVNWIKWALQGNEMESAWLDSLAMQVRYLRKRLEYHLLGNHLFANAKALVFAGLYFSGDEAEEWLSKGLAILERELPEQVLEDGGHFERSPMYHGIILEDVLDLINIKCVFAAEEPLLQELGGYAHRMLFWLQAMCHPDEEISFFNDATFGIAPRLNELEAYSDRLGLESPIELTDRLTHLRDSGFVRIVQDDAVALLNVGEIGPDYLPGHAHADMLSFELSLLEQRVIVNSGISCYGVSAERLRQRGTAAHSTVEINGENSSEVWGGFRVARRARLLELDIQTDAEDVLISCAHDGYKRLHGKPIHKRTWTFRNSHLSVVDTIQGQYNGAVVWYHLHPNVRAHWAQDINNGELALTNEQKMNWSVAGGEVSLEDTTYYPGFGLAVPNQTIKIMFTGSEVTFRLQWESK